MNRILIPALFVLMTTGLVSQETFLPNYMTDFEKSQLEYFRKHPPVYETDDPNPPPGPVRTMAEWEELQALQITWTAQLPYLLQNL